MQAKGRMLKRRQQWQRKEAGRRVLKQMTQVMAGRVRTTAERKATVGAGKKKRGQVETMRGLEAKAGINVVEVGIKETEVETGRGGEAESEEAEVGTDVSVVRKENGVAVQGKDVMIRMMTGVEDRALQGIGGGVGAGKEIVEEEVEAGNGGNQEVGKGKVQFVEQHQWILLMNYAGSGRGRRDRESGPVGAKVEREAVEDQDLIPGDGFHIPLTCRGDPKTCTKAVGWATYFVWLDDGLKKSWFLMKKWKFLSSVFFIKRISGKGRKSKKDS